MNEILGEEFQLKKGSHIYVFDPKGFDKETEKGCPVLFFDDSPIYANGVGQFTKPSYLSCECSDYFAREQAFREGRTYQHSNSAIQWGDVATCNHIALTRRHFARPFVKKVLKTINKQEGGDVRLVTAFSQSLEMHLFPEVGFGVVADFLKQ